MTMHEDGPMIHHRRRALAAALAVVVLAPAACSDDSNSNDSNGGSVTAPIDKTGTNERRTDLAPLTDRFATIGQPTDAVWMSGTLGSDAPGPTTYWIDAVITLEPSVAAALRDEHDPQPTDASTDVVADLVDDVPANLSRSDSLDRALSTNGFTSTAFLAVDTDVVVIVARGN